MENSADPNSLYNLQRWMRWVITDPRGVTAALGGTAPPTMDESAGRFRPHNSSRVLSRYLRPSPDCHELIATDPSFSRTNRLDVYAEGYFLRLVEAMGLDFVLVSKLMGGVNFSNVICDYLKEYPSSYPNIAEIGKNFPEFLSRHQVSAEFAPLVDLAKLEWLAIESFYATEVPPLTQSMISEIPPEKFGEVIFHMDPSVMSFESKWNFLPLWEKRNSNQQGAESESLPNCEASTRKTCYLIFRNHNFAVDLESQDEFEFSILKEALLKLTLGQICVNISSNPIWAEKTELVSQVFTKWIQKGLVRGLSLCT